SLVLGIELGRTFSRAGVYRDNVFEIIADEEGRTFVPSYVTFVQDGSPLIGYFAMEKSADHRENTIYDISLLLGQQLPDSDLEKIISGLPYTIIEKDEKLMIKGILGGQDHYFEPEEIAGLIIGKLKNMAEAHLGCSIGLALFTVPSEFNDIQRRAVKDAADFAGIELVKTINESIATGLGDGLDFPVYAYNPTHVPEHYIFYHLDDKDSSLALISVNMGILKEIAVVRSASVSGMLVEEHSSYSKIFPEKAVGLVRDLLQQANINITQIDSLIFAGNSATVAPVEEAIELFLGKKARSTENTWKIPVIAEDAILRGVSIQASLQKESGANAGFYWDNWVAVDLGVEMNQGVFATVLRRGGYRNRATGTFVITVDNQEKVLIKVYEGCRKMAKENELLGTVEILGLPFQPRGELEIDLTFMVDSGSFLTVIAKEKETGREGSLEVALPSREYTQDDIHKMIQEGELHTREDLLFVRAIDYGTNVHGEYEGGVMPKGGKLIGVDLMDSLLDEEIASLGL
ncbi:actin-like ATPase domain-containing protein, partial [Mollisia scopiformis]